MRPTAVFDTYWHFAARRQAMYLRRLEGGAGPWTDDPILRAYRFTNVYRATDRVSQYLIAEVQNGSQRSQAPTEVLFRTILFKIFNRIETWQLLERALGNLSWQATPLDAVCEVMDRAFATGRRLYSAAYIMPAPRLGAVRKHANHLALIRAMMDDGLPARIAASTSLEEVFEQLLAYPGLGHFLAFQYTIDLNYSSIIDFDEATFVVAGPGALDGIAKCFSDTDGRSPEELIHWVTDNQEHEFAERGIDFPGLFGRRLMPIDCQNLFCEISKYARVAHPEVPGVSGRTRIKQTYRAAGVDLPPPKFPASWGLLPLRASAPAKDLLGLIEDARHSEGVKHA